MSDIYKALGLELVVDDETRTVTATVTPGGGQPAVGMSFDF